MQPPPPNSVDTAPKSERHVYQVYIPGIISQFGRLEQCITKFNSSNAKNFIDCKVLQMNNGPYKDYAFLEAPNRIEANRCISLLTHSPLQESSFLDLGPADKATAVPPKLLNGKIEYPASRAPSKLPPLSPQVGDGQFTFGHLKHFMGDQRNRQYTDDKVLASNLVRYVMKVAIRSIMCVVFYSMYSIIEALRKLNTNYAEREQVLLDQIADLKRKAAEMSISNVQLFVAAALSEGLTYTQASRFLTKLNVGVPTESAFYKAQRELYNSFIFYAVHNVNLCRSQISQQVVLGFDTAWSNVRYANFALALFVDCVTQKIVDFQLCAKANHKILPNHLTASNCMEGVLFSALASRWSADELQAIVHDNDASTSLKVLAMGIDDLLDPRHWWKHYGTFWTSFTKKHEKEGSIEILKDSLKSFFNLLCGDYSLTADQKVQYWMNAKLHYRGDHSACLPTESDDTKAKKWDLPQSSLIVLDKFIDVMSNYITKIDTRYWTQLNECIHSQKNLVADKQHGWQGSWILRVCCVICQQNDPFLWFAKFVEWAGIATMSKTTVEQLQTMQKNKQLKAERNKTDKETLKETRIQKKKEQFEASQNVIKEDAHLSKSEPRIAKTVKPKTFKTTVIDGQNKQVTKVSAKLFSKLCPSLVGRSPKAAKPGLPESDIITVPVSQLQTKSIEYFEFRGMLSYFTTALALIMRCSKLETFLFSKLFPFNEQTKFAVYLKALFPTRATTHGAAKCDVDCAPLFWVLKNRGPYVLRKGVLESIYPAMTLIMSALKDAYTCVKSATEFDDLFAIQGTFVIQHRMDEEGIDAGRFKTHRPYVGDDHLGASVSLGRLCGRMLKSLPPPLCEQIKREFDVSQLTPAIPPTAWIDITAKTKWPSYLLIPYPLDKASWNIPPFDFSIDTKTHYKLLAVVIQNGSDTNSDEHELIGIQDFENDFEDNQKLILSKTLVALYAKIKFLFTIHCSISSISHLAPGDRSSFKFQRPWP